VNRHARSLLTILIVAILLAPVLLSRRCGSGDTTAPALTERPKTPIRGGRLVASQRSEPRTFNRMAPAASQPAEIFTFLTQAKLVRVNRTTGEIEPWLAERWTTTDNLTYTLTLRDGVQWSDGAPFTSADVTFSFEAVYQKGGMLVDSLSVAGKPLTATAPDARTVVITFPELLAPNLRLLDNMPVYPRHKLEAALRSGKFHEAW
jgi:peptide/nickel transport system substrate-binding protein